MSEYNDTPIENTRTEYREVCQNHRAITDFRAKLLTLLPLASGAGIFLLLRKQSEPLEAAHLVAIGVFGFVVTLGLFFHELRGIEHCEDLIKLGMALEAQLQVRKGQFTLEHDYYNPTGDFRIIRRVFHKIVGPIGAAWIIYPSVCVAWLYVTAVGLGIPIASLLTVLLGVLFIGASCWGFFRLWKLLNADKEGEEERKEEG